MIVGKYEINGRILVLPISGKGDFNITLSKYRNMFTLFYYYYYYHHHHHQYKGRGHVAHMRGESYKVLVEKPERYRLEDLGGDGE
jgi:Haemolymph juvenile hormone binding protein (JHBP).